MINKSEKKSLNRNLGAIAVSVPLLVAALGAILELVEMQDVFAADAVSDCFSYVANVVVDNDDLEAFTKHRADYINSLPSDAYLKQLNNGTPINSLTDLAAIYNNHPDERSDIGSGIGLNLTAAGFPDSEKKPIMNCIYETAASTNTNIN